MKYEIKQTTKFNNLVIVNKNDVKKSNMPRKNYQLLETEPISRKIYIQKNKKNKYTFGNINSLKIEV